RAAATRRVAWLDADGPDLPVLPVHRRRLDVVLVRRPDVAWRGATGHRAACSEARSDHFPARPVSARVPEFPGPLGPPHPGRAAADRDRVSVRQADRTLAR